MYVFGHHFADCVICKWLGLECLIVSGLVCVVCRALDFDKELRSNELITIDGNFDVKVIYKA